MAGLCQWDHRDRHQAHQRYSCSSLLCMPAWLHTDTTHTSPDRGLYRFLMVCVCVYGVCVFPGAQKEGAAGFFKGVGKGLVGAVARPTGGIIDMASSTFQGIKRCVLSSLHVSALDVCSCVFISLRVCGCVCLSPETCAVTPEVCWFSPPGRQRRRRMWSPYARLASSTKTGSYDHIRK